MGLLGDVIERNRMNRIIAPLLFASTGMFSRAIPDLRTLALRYLLANKSSNKTIPDYDDSMWWWEGEYYENIGTDMHTLSDVGNDDVVDRDLDQEGGSVDELEV
eukprot:scaffold45329_cov57-Attheya_sp.AAC.2